MKAKARLTEEAGSMSKNSNIREDETPSVAAKAEAEETEPLVPAAVAASPAKVPLNFLLNARSRSIAALITSSD